MTAMLFDPRKNILLFGVISILAIVLLIVGFVVLWALGLLTGVIMALVLLVISWALLNTGAIPVEKYPWTPMLMWILPVAGFFFGVIGERRGVFYVTPLIEKAQLITPYYAGQEIQWVQTNIETILIFIVLICLVAVLVKSGKGK